MEDDKFLEELRKVLDYNPETGDFRWRFAVSNRVKAGSPAGTVSSQGRVRIKFGNKKYFAHRLAWLMTCGKWPDQMIDHLDGNPSNNRINNLRDVSGSINNQNQRKARCDNKSGLLGVSTLKSGKFQAQICSNKKVKHLGYFLTAGEAYETYLSTKRELHEGNTL